MYNRLVRAGRYPRGAHRLVTAVHGVARVPRDTIHQLLVDLQLTDEVEVGGAVHFNTPANKPEYVFFYSNFVLYHWLNLNLI